MRGLLILVVLAFAACEVRKLTESDFDTVVGGDKDVFIKFFAPWCGHCKSLAPDYETLSEKFAGSGKVVVAEVDCDSEKTLCGKFGIQGFPTLKYFPKKSITPEDYNGGRTVDDLTTFVEGKSGARAKGGKRSKVQALTPATFDSVVMDANKDAIVKFYAPWCGHCKSLAPKYEKVAEIFESDEHIVIAEVNCDDAANKELCGKYEIHGFPTLKFFGKKNKAGVAYEGGREEKDFIEFLNNNAGTKRTAEGKLDTNAGVIQALGETVKEFMAAKDKKAALAKLGEKVKEHAEETAVYYEKVAAKIAENGIDWVKTEKARLQKMVDGEGVSKKKIDAFLKNINILGIFE